MKYDDILHLPRPTSRHPKMSLSDRAAQFAPFAALTGHEDAVRETARLTDAYIELDEGQRELLDQRLRILLAAMNDNFGFEPEVTVIYFKPDGKKDGGAYVPVSGRVKKVDRHLREILLVDGSAIPMDYIVSIKGDVLERIEES